jgi:hypothetical protein
MSTDRSDDDLDRELSAAGAQWRSAQPGPPAVDPGLFDRAATRRRSRFTAVAVAAAVVLIAGGLMLAVNTSRQAGTAGPMAPASSPAVSTPPPDTMGPTAEPSPADPESAAPPLICSVYRGTAPAEAATTAPSPGPEGAPTIITCGDSPDGPVGWCAGTGPTGAPEPAEPPVSAEPSVTAAPSAGDAEPPVGATCSVGAGSCGTKDGSIQVTCVNCDVAGAPGVTTPPVAPAPAVTAPPTAAHAAATASETTATTPPELTEAPPATTSAPTAPDMPPCPGIAEPCPPGATCSFCTEISLVSPAAGTDAENPPMASSDGTATCPDVPAAEPSSAPAPAPTAVPAPPSAPQASATAETPPTSGTR